MQLFCNVLKAAIDDYGMKNRSESNPFFDAYGEIAIALNKSTSTVRKWTNPFSGELPKVNDLLTLCRFIGDRRPFDVLQAEFNRVYGGSK